MKKLPKPVTLIAIVLSVAGIAAVVIQSLPKQSGPSQHDVREAVNEMTREYKLPPLSREEAMEGIAGMAGPGAGAGAKSKK
jgi:hypothetical protein